MSNYQMNCAIIYFCLLIGCRSNEPNDQISESRYVATSILYAHGMSQRLLRLPPDMANINVMTYVAPMRCDAVAIPFRLIDLSPTTPSRQVTSICGWHHNEHFPYKVARAEAASTENKARKGADPFMQSAFA